jgi:hypothetical protein
MTFGYLAVRHMLNGATAAGPPQAAASFDAPSSTGGR